LTDGEWRAIAREVLDRTGFAPHGDEEARRWIVVGMPTTTSTFS
jgi:hypothetical protein